jgi:hypothetical protein
MQKNHNNNFKRFLLIEKLYKKTKFQLNLKKLILVASLSLSSFRTYENSKKTSK